MVDQTRLRYRARHNTRQFRRAPVDSAAKSVVRRAVERLLRIVLEKHIRRFVPSAPQQVPRSARGGVPTPFLCISSHIVDPGRAHALESSDCREIAPSEIAKGNDVLAEILAGGLLPVVYGRKGF